MNCNTTHYRANSSSVPGDPTGPGEVTLKNGVISGAFLWFGFILTTMVVNFCFSGRDKRLLLIDLGNWLIVLVVMGAVIGWLGV